MQNQLYHLRINISFTDFTYMFQIFIDRDPVLFEKVLKYLRTKEVDLRYFELFMFSKSGVVIKIK